MRGKEYPLRAIKHAKTRLAIMRAFMERLKRDRFESISVAKVCEDAEVAQGTVFNYFPVKIDVLAYYLRLTMAKMIGTAERKSVAGKYLAKIEAVFSQVSKEWENSNLSCQILSVLLGQTERPKWVEISGVEKRMAFPRCEGIEETADECFGGWLKKCISSAIKSGELPPKADQSDILVSLTTLMFGTFLSVRFHGCGRRDYHYKRQLHILWNSMGVKGS
jgi:AcrR family transcriptional regulator